MRFRLGLALSIFIFVCLFVVSGVGAFKLRLPIDTNANNLENLLEVDDQRINDNVIVLGNNVFYRSATSGDVLALGSTLNINASIDGDVAAAGGLIDFSGRAEDLRIVAGQVIIKGEADRDILVFGGEITLSEGAKIKGDVFLSGSKITIASAQIGGKLVVRGGTVLIGNSKIDGDVDVAVEEDVVVSEKTEIAGNFVYQSKNEAKISPNVKISGNLERKFPTAKDLNKITITRVSRKIISFVALLLIGALLLNFIPKTTLKISDQIASGFWRNIGVGILTLFGLPILFLALIFTLFGIPISLIGFAGYLSLIYLARIFVSLAIGQWFAQIKYFKKLAIGWQYFLGLVIYFLIIEIPIVGPIFSLLALITGFGATLIAKIDLYKEFRTRL